MAAPTAMCAPCVKPEGPPPPVAAAFAAAAAAPPRAAPAGNRVESESKSTKES